MDNHGSVILFDISYNNIGTDEVLRGVENLVRDGGVHFIFTPNVEDVVISRSNEEFKEALNSATYNITDGKWIIYSSRLLGKRLNQFVGGRLIFLKICELAVTKGWNIYLFGSKNNGAEGARRKLEAIYRNISIVGALSPNFDLLKDVESTNKVINDINDRRTDILFVGFGSPKGKLWLHRNKHKLKPLVALEIGGAFDVLSGNRSEPPKWMTFYGFEWLFRLVTEPKYVLKRYLIRFPRFFLIFMKEFVKKHAR
ncbi:MAG: WecB/TagA/CpsF family glycosyltransferase [Bacteroidota bacterium]